MTKAEMIIAVAEKAGMTKKDAEKAVSAVLETVTETLKKGDKVSLTGFGSFEVRTRAAHAGINPKTKAPITIAASKAPVFKAGKALKDAVKYFGFWSRCIGTGSFLKKGPFHETR